MPSPGVSVHEEWYVERANRTKIKKRYRRLWDGDSRRVHIRAQRTDTTQIPFKYTTGETAETNKEIWRYQARRGRQVEHADKKTGLLRAFPTRKAQIIVKRHEILPRQRLPMHASSFSTRGKWRKRNRKRSKRSTACKAKMEVAKHWRTTKHYNPVARVKPVRLRRIWHHQPPKNGTIQSKSWYRKQIDWYIITVYNSLKHWNENTDTFTTTLGPRRSRSTTSTPNIQIIACRALQDDTEPVWTTSRIKTKTTTKCEKAKVGGICNEICPFPATERPQTWWRPYKNKHKNRKPTSNLKALREKNQ